MASISSGSSFRDSAWCLFTYGRRPVALYVRTASGGSSRTDDPSAPCGWERRFIGPLLWPVSRSSRCRCRRPVTSSLCRGLLAERPVSANHRRRLRRSDKSESGLMARPASGGERGAAAAGSGDGFTIGPFPEGKHGRPAHRKQMIALMTGTQSRRKSALAE